jgi:hypothetical protein
MAGEVRRAAAVCGLAAAVAAYMIPVVGSVVIDEEYSQLSQYISELGAREAPYGEQVSLLGFLPIGILVLIFLVCARPSLPPGWTTNLGLLALSAIGAAYLVAAFFRCDPGCPSQGSTSQSVHNLFGLLEYGGALSGLLLLASAFHGSTSWRSATTPTIIAAALVGVGLLGLLTPALVLLRGLFQRIAEASIFLWIARTSGALYRL